MDTQDLIERRKLISPHLHRTPVMTSTQLNTLSGADLYFKCENFQRMGAFKMRGALSAMVALSPEQRSRGVVTHSSGNFAQAVALSAQALRIPAYIVMPRNAPMVKQRAVDGYDGRIILCEPTMEAREAEAEKVRRGTGATFIHPSNDLNVIMGNATATLELIEDAPVLEAIFAPVGGGGLIAGTVLAAEALAPDCRIYGGEPFEADDAYRSLKSGKIEFNETTNTIADGLKTHLGDINFPILRRGVAEIFRVTEEQILEAMKLVWERMKLVIEPSGAVSLAALLANGEAFAGKSVGIILSGGNVDLGALPF